MFGYKKKQQQETAGPKQARDMHSFAIHIETEKGSPLCGTRNAMYGTIPVTPEKVLSSLDMQHGGFYWCDACGSAFTGEPQETFIATRYSRGE